MSYISLTHTNNFRTLYTTKIYGIREKSMLWLTKRSEYGIMAMKICCCRE